MNRIRSYLLCFVYFSILASSNYSWGQTSVQDPSIAISQSANALAQYKTLQSKCGIQNADIAFSVKKALSIADLLISENGVLNASLCPLIKSYFFSSPLLEYEMQMEKVLDQLDGTWQPIFDGIVKPQDEGSASTKMIRALFGLTPNQVVTDRHAKVAALSALLAPFDQGSVGDCFAVCVLVRDHRESFKFTLKDHVAIIDKGYITRLLGTTSENFFFFPTLPDSELNRSYTVDANGMIASGSVSLFLAPGIKAAFNVMGSHLIANANANVLRILFKGTPVGKIKVTSLQVIGALASAIVAQLPNQNWSELVETGKLGFSSLSNNPILKATECAYAAMAETRPKTSVRANLNNSVNKALASVWTALGTSTLAKTFKTKFLAALNESYRYIYKLSIDLPTGSLVGKSSAGGFLLFERIPGNPEQAGFQVVTPQDFRHLVLDVIARVESILGQTYEVQAMGSIVSQYVEKDLFLRDVLWAFDSANSQISDPIANYAILARTPMRSINGASSYEVASVDTNTDYQANVTRYRPDSPASWLTWCLAMAKLAPAKLIPMTAPNHAFNFVPTNPDLASYRASTLTSDVWVRNMVITPGMKVSVTPIDASLMTALSKAVYTKVASRVPSQTAYQQMVASLSSQNISIQGFSQGLVNGINALANSSTTQAKEVGVIVDGCLFSTLPPITFSILEKSAVRIAFTNWNDGAKNEYFAAYFNPRTMQIGFGMIDEDKTKLRLQDEIKWVINQEWSVNLVAPPPMDRILGEHQLMDVMCWQENFSEAASF